MSSKAQQKSWMDKGALINNADKKEKYVLNHKKPETSRSIGLLDWMPGRRKSKVDYRVDSLPKTNVGLITFVLKEMEQHYLDSRRDLLTPSVKAAVSQLLTVHNRWLIY